MVCGVPDTCQGQNASVLSVPRLGRIYTCNPLPRSNENFAHSGALPRLRTLIRRLAANPRLRRPCGKMFWTATRLKLMRRCKRRWAYCLRRKGGDC